jgi:hypothetical protein
VFCIVSGAEKQGDEDAKTTFQAKKMKIEKKNFFEKVKIAKIKISVCVSYRFCVRVCISRLARIVWHVPFRVSCLKLWHTSCRNCPPLPRAHWIGPEGQIYHKFFANFHPFFLQNLVVY